MRNRLFGVVQLAILGWFVVPNCSADFLTAIKTGNVGEVREYISQNKILINAKILGGVTPLQLAIDTRQTEVAKLLIQSGANIKVLNPDGLTMLQHAAYLDEADIAELLIKQGAEVDLLLGNLTPLSIAAGNGSLKAAKVLVEAGADVNNPAARPLSSAAARNNLALVQFLLKKGARCDYASDDGNTYLHYHAVDLIDAFLSCGLNINVKNKAGDTPLSNALAWGDDSVPLAERLIARGADVNARNNAGQTPLLRSASNGHASRDIVRIMLEHGADVNARDSAGYSLLLYLASRSKADNKNAVEYAIARGADIHAKVASNRQVSREGWTALQFAAESGQVGVGKLLIAKGADVSEATRLQETPLSLSLAAGHTDFARMLIDKGAKVNTRDRAGSAPLDIAVNNGNVEAVRFLLEHGADYQAKSLADGGTPLIHAVKVGSLECSRLLIQKGAGVNARDSAGMSALHWAAKDGREELAQLLLVHGADVNAPDNSGLTPILMSVQPITRLLQGKDAVQPAQESSALGSLACQAVVERANSGRLGTFGKVRQSGEELMHGGNEGWEDDELGSVDTLRTIDFKGGHFILGMAGTQPVYLSRVGQNHHEEILCRIGHKEGVAGYFVRSYADVAVSRYLRTAQMEPPSLPDFPPTLPRTIADGAEIHAISGYEVEPGGASHAASNVVSVTVDRPGRKVLLLLNSFRPVEWHVKSTPGTQLTGVLFASIAGGNSRAESDSTVTASVTVYRVQMPYALDDLQSPEFSYLMYQLDKWAGRRNVDSFFGKYYLPTTINVGKSGTADPRLSLDYPPVQAAPRDMRFELYDRAASPVKWSLSGPASDGKAVKYFGAGRMAISPNGSELFLVADNRFLVVDLQTGTTGYFALPSGFPAMSWASDVAYDTRRDIVSVSSYGGEGFLYRFDARRHRWLDYHSLHDVDIYSLAYDKVLDRYLGWTDDGALLSIDSSGEMSTKQAVASRLPGFRRIYSDDMLHQRVMEIRPQGKDVALIGLGKDKVLGVWYYNIDSGNALLTYKAK